jgi:hypothetical protein
LRTNLNAVRIGSLAAQALLNAKSGILGEIVAAFPNSFYMKTANHELVFVTSRQLKSPITINLDSRTNLGQMVRPLDAVSLQENEIHVGESTSIDLSKALPYRQHLTPQIHQLAITRKTLHFGSLILMIIDNHLSVLDPSGFAHAGALEFVSDGVVPLRLSDDIKHFCDTARKIVGLGGGFTPSGDDLLGGFLATYNAYARDVDRESILLGFDFLESKTNWISAKLLDYMQRQVLDDQLGELIDSAASGDEFIMALETLLPRGHTSGIDILVGVMLAFGLMMDITSRIDETATIAKRLGLSS